MICTRCRGEKRGISLWHPCREVRGIEQRESDGEGGEARYFEVKDVASGLTDRLTCKESGEMDVKV